jgi:hypothetical protein
MKARWPTAARNVVCGAWCPPGWTHLVEPLFDLCEQHGVEVHQVKQKFGGLRFYTGPAPKDVTRAIALAENESFATCEVCAGAGRSRRGCQTLCDAHAERSEP